jgi:DNA-binding PucR family transcriptional regulator
MERDFPWYRAMPAEHRSWIGLVLQAGFTAFIEWFRHPDARRAVTADVFGTAPRELTRAVTLQQTVQLVRTAIGVVEEQVEELAAPHDLAYLREAVLRYSREIAFAAAQVYAQAAEARGAWDARLEALVVDALLRGDADESLSSRAAALGWTSVEPIVVLAGRAPASDSEAVADAIRRAARAAKLAKLDVLTGVHGERLVAIVGGVKDDPLAAARAVVHEFGPGPVVVGDQVPDLRSAGRSARAALAGLAAAPAWPDAPRPVLAEDLLPERALDGDTHAQRRLVEDVYAPLEAAGASLLETVTAYLGQASSLEATARMLFVHPNTVRYRLRRVTEITGLAPSDGRSAFTLQVGLALGRLHRARKGAVAGHA